MQERRYESNVNADERGRKKGLRENRGSVKDKGEIEKGIRQIR